MLNNLKNLPAESFGLDALASHFKGQIPQDFSADQLNYLSQLEAMSKLSENMPPAQLFQQFSQGFKPAGFSKPTMINPAVKDAPKSSAVSPPKKEDVKEELGKRPLDLEGDDDEEGSDDGSLSDESKKRGRYKTYTEEEKGQIIEFMMKHGTQKTLEIFSSNEHKITKRKLKSWMDSQHKVKGVKGRKSNDPARDNSLFNWCMEFQKEHGRPPSRKEATKKALELSEDPEFQASKGWLDKFSRKFNIEFTPLKIIPPRGKKVKTDGEAESASTVPEMAMADLTPMLKTNKPAVKPPVLEAKKNNSIPIDKNSPNTAEKEATPKASNGLTLNPKSMFQQPQHAHPITPNPQGSLFQKPSTNPVEKKQLPSMESSILSGFPGLEGGHPQSYPFPFYPLDYGMQYPLGLQQAFSMANRKPFPMGFPMNMPQPSLQDLAEQMKLLQQAMKKDDEKTT